CPVYTYSSEGASVCSPCADGYASGIGYTVCVDCLVEPDLCECGAGYYTDTSILTGDRCRSCPAGSYCAIGQKYACTGDTYSFGGATECSDCIEGWLCSDGIALPCLDNTYADTDSGTCIDCIDGYICTDGLLDPCPVGFYHYTYDEAYEPSEYEALFPYQCIPCSPGYISTSEASTECTVCPDGQTSNYVRDACVDCRAGAYSTGGAACSSCAAGTYSDSGADGCTDCLAGTYSERGSPTCVDCPAGYYQDTDAQGECIACPANTYSTTIGSSDPALCLSCPDGTVSDEGSSECV
ncbi:hypothetical protein KIPB_003753, partial [Kipferlia bialata]